MQLLQFVHEGLGNSSYVVPTGGGSAAVIDPDRTVRRYLQAAEGKGLRIEAVVETHVHADFVTGALELAAATGATVYTPHGSGVSYHHYPVAGGQGVRLADSTLEALHAPGHTPEHLAYTLSLPGSEPVLFSGGSLIVGGAARTDLLSPELTEPLTRAQYHTLREAFAALPDSTVVYPTHGGGSFCSAGSADERKTTLGSERRLNPALREMPEEEFVRWFPSTFPGVPRYYAKMRDFNQAGPRLRKDIPMPQPLSAEEFRRAATGALVVDVRPPEQYLPRHIPGSLSNDFRSGFAVWLGWLVDLGAPLLFVTEDDPVEAVVDECLLVGHESFRGYLDGGITAWERAGLPLTSTEAVDPASARRLLADGALPLDVREPNEYRAGHIEGALHIPLGDLEANLARIPRDRPVLTYCAAGQRSSSAAAILERAGFTDVRNLAGGFSRWR